MKLQFWVLGLRKSFLWKINSIEKTKVNSTGIHFRIKYLTRNFLSHKLDVAVYVLTNKKVRTGIFTFILLINQIRIEPSWWSWKWALLLFRVYFFHHIHHHHYTHTLYFSENDLAPIFGFADVGTQFNFEIILIMNVINTRAPGGQTRDTDNAWPRLTWPRLTWPRLTWTCDVGLVMITCSCVCICQTTKRVEKGPLL